MKFDFVGHRKIFFSISIIVILLGFLSLGFKGLNLGVDFTSGTRIDVVTEVQLDEKTIKEELKEIGVEPKTLLFSEGETNRSTIVLNSDYSKEDVANVSTHFEEKYEAEMTVSEVSPQVGKELAKNAFYALLLAGLGICLYLIVRFEWIKSLATLVGILHNILIMVGVFSILQVEVDITFIAAVLTIVGYSINDTIVTFDRIRENSVGKSFDTFEEISKVTNDSLIQILGRSINTVLTVLFAAIALMFLGSEAIWSFSLALIIGLVAGIYSSMFISSQLWTIWKFKHLQYRKKNPVKSIEEDNDWI